MAQVIAVGALTAWVVFLDFALRRQEKIEAGYECSSQVRGDFSEVR